MVNDGIIAAIVFAIEMILIFVVVIKVSNEIDNNYTYRKDRSEEDDGRKDNRDNN